MYTLNASVQDGDKDLVLAFINGINAVVASVSGAVVTLANPGFTVDSGDTIIFRYQS